MKRYHLIVLTFLFVQIAIAQPTLTESGDFLNEEENTPVLTESGKPLYPDQSTAAVATPLDSPYNRHLMANRRTLPYEHIREADVMWEKRIWRVIDTRERMNQYFAWPTRPLAQIILDHVKNGNLTAYDAIDDQFKHPMTKEDIQADLFGMDTFPIYDPDTYEMRMTIVPREFNPEDVVRYRLKEVWFFDEESSRMHVRILGIAPMIEKEIGETGQTFEVPMFWIHYPSARKVLGHEMAFNAFNQTDHRSWEDMFESRYFASTVIKAANVHDQRIQDYCNGVNALLEAEKIEEGIFNFEHDLWTY